MRVFLVYYSYHKSEWSGRCNWGPRRIFAETEKEAREKVIKNAAKNCGIRIDYIQDVTGKPHKIPFKTVF